MISDSDFKDLRTEKTLLTRKFIESVSDLSMFENASLKEIDAKARELVPAVASQNKKVRNLMNRGKYWHSDHFRLVRRLVKGLITNPGFLKGFTRSIFEGKFGEIAQKSSRSEKSSQISNVTKGISKGKEECPHCHKLMNKWYLKNHIDAKHLFKRIACPHKGCKKKFKYMTELYPHQKQHRSKK